MKLTVQILLKFRGSSEEFREMLSPRAPSDPAPVGEPLAHLGWAHNGRPSRRERELRVAALKEHAASGGDLTISGYARAGRASRATVRALVRQLGLPVLPYEGRKSR